MKKGLFASAILLAAVVFVGGCVENEKDAVMEEAAVLQDKMVEGGEAMMEEGEGMLKEGEAMMMEIGEPDVTFDVTGENFAFSQTEMTVQKGDTVQVNFSSTSGFHDWMVEEFAVATEQVRPEDGVTSVTFVADQAGTFEYFCSVGSHRAQGMVGTLTVEDTGEAMVDEAVDAMLEDTGDDE